MKNDECQMRETLQLLCLYTTCYVQTKHVFLGYNVCTAIHQSMRKEGKTFYGETAAKCDR
jgi:hypothetical protein